MHSTQSFDYYIQAAFYLNKSNMHQKSDLVQSQSQVFFKYFNHPTNQTRIKYQEHQHFLQSPLDDFTQLSPFTK